MTEQSPAEPVRAHGPLWSLLDWSFWGAGMGDVFREPLADTMLAAIPVETVTQAEGIMADFIERRKIEKTGVTVWQEQRDELAAALARIAELETELAEQKQATEYFDSQSKRRKTQRDEARTELAKYVGHEPTIAEEMAYVSNCLDAVYALCHETKTSGALGVTPEAVEQAASGEWTAATPRPALPWAHVMDDSELGLFLDDLVSAAMGRWRSDPDLPARTVLADIEKACQDWRTPGQGLRGDEPGTGEGR
ncbi:hypothetical protein ACFXKI_09895 [Streptomyces mirabilis]|uniref:hypothetical protein n=1 Tax=Streptomyces mirabilis TaxID=68239 RepID=UPI0036A6E489